jgi:hypothetical protein
MLMANPHPEPHPENLIPLKKGDPSAREVQSKGGKAKAEMMARKRTMREWAELYGQLPLQKGKLKDPKTAQDLGKDPKTGLPKSNVTMDGAILASAYAKAMKGDVRAMQFLATIKGEYNQEVTVHTDPVATLSEEQLDAIIDAITQAKKPDE